MDSCSIPGLGRCPGGGHGNPLQDPAWRIPWTEEPGRVQSHEESDMTEPLSMHALPAGVGGGSPHLMSRLWVGCIVSHQLTYGSCVTPCLLGSAIMPHSLALSASLEWAQFIDTGAYHPSRREPIDPSVRGCYFVSSGFYLFGCTG